MCWSPESRKIGSLIQDQTMMLHWTTVDFTHSNINNPHAHWTKDPLTLSANEMVADKLN